VRALLLPLAVLAGCTLLARDHACYPFLAHQLGGHVPNDVLRTLAHERGTRKQVGRQRAPMGYYFRRRGTPAPAVIEVRTAMGGYELARCPEAPVAPVR